MRELSGFNGWRIVKHPGRNGAWNMAADEAILRAVARRIVPPTLRLYAWDPPCLSLGHAQPITDVDRDRLASYGWDIVRRPTGGRAILHKQELTYAIIAPDNHSLMRGGVLESYRRVSKALVKGLERLAISVEVQEADSNSEAERNHPICFEIPSAYEITVDGKKIIGSAQVRRRKTVLQHGSLPLSGDLGQICDVLHYQDPSQRMNAYLQLKQRAGTIEDISGREVQWDEACDALIEGFQSAFDLEFTPGELSQEEEMDLQRLLPERYLNPSWTERVIATAPKEQGNA